MNRFFKACAAGLTVALMGLASFSAQASVATTSTFLFNSFCEDCVNLDDESDSSSNHPVSATLVLLGNNFTDGQDFNLSDFVSFTYSGSNRLPKYTITNSSAIGFYASYYERDTKDGMETLFSLNIKDGGLGLYFRSYPSGEGDALWDTGYQNISADQGSTHTWQEVNPTGDPATVPEPSSMLLVGAALAGLGLSRRRRQV